MGFMDWTSGFVFAFLTIVALATISLALVAIARRRQQEWYFRRFDELRHICEPVLSDLLAGTCTIGHAATFLKARFGTDCAFAVEKILLAVNLTEVQIPRARMFCEELGLVDTWQKNLVGQSERKPLRDALAAPHGIVDRFDRLGFVLRARSARNLGLIRHHDSWPLLVRALYDDHPDVQAAAARALARIGEPWSLSALIERLHTAAQNRRANIPLRFLRASLADFPLSEAFNLLPSLRHPDGRIRFLATDIIREMVARQSFREGERILGSGDFSPELSECFLSQVAKDESPDVRARCAAVVACLDNRDVSGVLIDLLRDPAWFVRLHAVRALAKQSFLPQISQIARGLTDPHWRVRQAAVRTLLTFGRCGIEQIFSAFAKSDVPDSMEQIADEIQRAGLIPVLLAELNEPHNEPARQAIERLTAMGKSSCLVASLQNGSGQALTKFVESFSGSASPTMQSCLEALTDQRRIAEPKTMVSSRAHAA